MQNNEFIAIPVQAVERRFAPPFYESRVRLLRMEVIDTGEEIDYESVRALCVPFAATLYDNLLDAGENIMGIYENFTELFCNGEDTGFYLYLCALYARMGEVIPEPVQWVSSHDSVLSVFCEMLCDLLTDYLLADGFINDDEESES